MCAQARGGSGALWYVGCKHSVQDLRSLLHALGFTERIKGDHHIYSKEGVIEILNLQPRYSFAKPYQVRQVRAVMVRYKLAEGIE